MTSVAPSAPARSWTKLGLLTLVLGLILIVAGGALYAASYQVAGEGGFILGMVLFVVGIARWRSEENAVKESLFSTKNLVATAVGIALYAALTIPFNVFTIPGVYDVAVRPTVAIPIVFGFVFGPVAGFFSGFIGNVISDQLSFGAFFWNWDLGNGLIGLVPAIGYYGVKHSDWVKTRGIAALSTLAVVASVVGIGFSALTDYVFQIGLNTVGAAVAEFIPAAATDAVNGAILAPILIYAYVRSTAGRARRL